MQPAVPHAELHAADSVSGQRGGQAHTQGGSRDRLQHQTLVLVAWQGLVGAVVIQPLEPTLDMCQLGEHAHTHIHTPMYMQTYTRRTQQALSCEL